jgi:membrane protein implicated in regulation of membrane protease activity
MSTIQQSPDSDPRPEKNDVTTRRVLLTIAIIGGALLFMVLPWIFLFHAPEQFAGWAASGVVMAIAVHLFLNTRKRRKALDEMLDEEDDDTTPAP